MPFISVIAPFHRATHSLIYAGISVHYQLLGEISAFVTGLIFPLAACSFALVINITDHTHLPKKFHLVTHFIAC